MKKRYWIPLVIVVLIAGYGVLTLSRMGAFTDVESEFAGSCRQVAGVPGPEDLTIHPESGIAYISSNDWTSIMAGDGGSVPPGAIYAYDLKNPDAGPINITLDATSEFRPHGISLWTAGGSGPDRLLVVSHPVRNGVQQHEIVVFEVLDFALRQVNVIQEPTPDSPVFMTNPNDIVALGPSEFYVTNDHHYLDRDWQFVENLFRMGIATVAYFDGVEFREAASGFNYPNGIEKAADDGTILVASSQNQSITLMTRTPDTGALTEESVIEIDGWADNLNWAPDGSLLVGAHPNAYALTRHFGDTSKLSPGRVVRVRLDGEEPVTETVYQTDGSEISSLSVAAQWGNRLLIGAITSDYFLDCTLPQ